MEPQLGRPQPLYRRRQRARDRRRGEPDADDLRAGAALCREPARQFRGDATGQIGSMVPPAQSVSAPGIAMCPAALAASAAQVGLWTGTGPSHRHRRTGTSLFLLDDCHRPRHILRRSCLQQCAGTPPVVCRRRKSKPRWIWARTRLNLSLRGVAQHRHRLACRGDVGICPFLRRGDRHHLHRRTGVRPADLDLLATHSPAQASRH